MMHATAARSQARCNTAWYAACFAAYTNCDLNEGPRFEGMPVHTHVLGSVLAVDLDTREVSASHASLHDAEVLEAVVVLHNSITICAD